MTTKIHDEDIVLSPSSAPPHFSTELIRAFCSELGQWKNFQAYFEMTRGRRNADISHSVPTNCKPFSLYVNTFSAGIQRTSELSTHDQFSIDFSPDFGV